MIEVGRIGFNLTLMGDADKRMIAFREATKSATIAVGQLNKALDILNPKLSTLGDILMVVSKGFTSLNTKILSTANRTERLIAKNEALKNSFRSVASSATAAAVAIGGVGGGGRRGGHGGGNFSHGIGHVSREFGLGKAGLVGSMMARGGGGIALGGAIGAAMLLKSSYENASLFQQGQAQFAGQGFGAASNNQATRAALGMGLRGVSSVDALQAINDAATVTRNVPEAIALAPAVAKMEFANKISYAAKGKQFTSNDEMRMLQLAELRSGTTDPTKFIPQLELIEKAYASDAARLNSNDLRTFGRQGGAFIHNLSDRGFMMMTPLMQSLGGQRTATGFNTMQTSLFKGQNMRTGKKAVAEFERLGLYKNGKLDPRYYQQLNESPVDFVYSTLLPKMASKGITSSANISSELSILFTQSVTRVIQQAIAQQPRIMAQVGLIPKASGIEAGYMTALKTNPGNIRAFETSWESLMTAIGKFSSPAINSAMNTATHFFDFITNFLTVISGTTIGGNHPILNWLARHQVNNDSTNNLGVDTKVGTAKTTTVQVNAVHHLDGQKIMESVSLHQARAMGAPSTGPTQFNGSNFLGATTPNFVGNF